MIMKRKRDCADNVQYPSKKAKASVNITGNCGTSGNKTNIVVNQTVAVPMHKERIRKLAPPRPFPTVPTSVSASGPKSTHKEGKNFMCITRQTPLAVYLTRCKKVLVEEGFDTLHLHAMGAAIPHLLTLAVSLPPILPFPKEDMKTEVRTGTIEVVDEIIPDDEDEDISMRTRGKGGVSILLKVNKKESLPLVPAQPSTPNDKSKRKPIPSQSRKPAPIIVYEEQDDN